MVALSIAGRSSAGMARPLESLVNVSHGWTSAAILVRSRNVGATRSPISIRGPNPCLLGMAHAVIHLDIGGCVRNGYGAVCECPTNYTCVAKGKYCGFETAAFQACARRTEAGEVPSGDPLMGMKCTETPGTPPALVPPWFKVRNVRCTIGRK